MLKKIGSRLILFVIVLIISQLIYSKWFYEEDIQKHSEVINKVREIPNDADIIYIGESSNITWRKDDIDKRKISQFIGDYFSTLKVCDITKPASHAGIYKTLLRNVSKENQAKTLIVTLNLRSFDAQWIYSELETPLQKSMVLIKDYPALYNRFLLSFKGYDIKTAKERERQFKRKWRRDVFHLPFDFPFKNVREWDKWMANTGIKDKDGNFDQAQTALACHYIKAYGFQLDTLDNPRIEDFNDIIELAHERNWNIVFNLLAENTEKAEQLVGKELIYLMNKNAQILEDYYTRKGVVVVNNLNFVEDNQFIDQNWTTEHYAEKGRKIIAQNVAKALKRWHSGYEEKEINQTTFFNDCEGNTVWEQMYTLSKDKAYAGNKSSRTGNGNDYSITLVFSSDSFSKDKENYIDINFMAYQESLDHDAKLVIQTGEGYWNGFELNKTVTEANRWLQYHQKIKVFDEIKDANLIKIYLYNPTKTNIYIFPRLF